ncbi:MAG: hypothetical protein EZS28_026883, partial [Streblomastix strix]
FTLTPDVNDPIGSGGIIRAIDSTVSIKGTGNEFRNIVKTIPIQVDSKLGIGGSVIYYSSSIQTTSLTVEGAYFLDCKTQALIPLESLYGGAIYIDQHQIGNTIEFDRAIFESSVVESNQPSTIVRGAAIYVKLHEEGGATNSKFHVYNSQFIRGNASGGAGAIFIEGINVEEFDFKSDFFQKNEVFAIIDGKYLGSDIVINVDSQPPFDTTTTILNGFLEGSSSTSQRYYVYIYPIGIDYDNQSLINILGGGVGYADALDGIDTEGCGDIQKQCKTITYTRTQLGEIPDKDGQFGLITTVLIKNNFELETDLISQEQELVIRSQESSNKPVISSPGSYTSDKQEFFSVITEGNLELNTVKITLQRDGFVLFRITGGTLDIINTDIEYSLQQGQLQLGNISIIQNGNQGEKISITDSSFANIYSTDHNGTLIHLNYTNGDSTKFSIKNGNITNLWAQGAGASGGAIYINIDDGYDLQEKDLLDKDLYISNVTFSLNHAQIGENIYLEAKDLRTLFTDNDLDDIIELQDTTVEGENSVGGDRSLGSDGNPYLILLQNFKQNNRNPVYVGNQAGPLEGRDAPWCGSQAPLHCKTLDFAVNNRIDLTLPATINIIGSTAIDKEVIIVEFGQNLVIQSNTNEYAEITLTKPNLDGLDESKSYINFLRDSALRNLRINFGDKVLPYPFINFPWNSFKLTLDNVIFSNGSFNDHIIHISNGASLEVIDSEFQNLTGISSGSVLQAELIYPGSVIFTTVIFNGNSITGSEKGAAVYIKTIDSVRYISGSVTAIQFTNTTNTTFSNNHGNNNVVSNLYIDLENGNFAQMMVNKRIDLGGIYGLEKEPIQYPHPQYAGKGSKSEWIDLSIFVKNVTISKTFANELDSWSSEETWCGYEDFPCKTLNTAASNSQGSHQSATISVTVIEQTSITEPIIYEEHSLSFIGVLKQVDDSEDEGEFRPKVVINGNNLILTDETPYLIMSNARISIENLNFEIRGQNPFVQSIIYKGPDEIENDKLNLKNVKFSSIDNFIFTRQALIQLINSNANIEQSQFHSINTQSQGTIFLNTQNVTTQSIISQSEFVNCTTQEGNGGALVIQFGTGTERGPVILQEVLVDGCNGTNTSAGSAVLIAGQVSEKLFYVIDCFFKNNGNQPGSSVLDGSDLYYIDYTREDTLENITHFISSFSNSRSRKIGGNVHYPQFDQPNFDYLLPNITENYYIRVNLPVEEDKQDGTLQFPFDNIKKAIDVLPKRGIVKPNIYLIDIDTFEHGEIIIGDKIVSIQGGYKLEPLEPLQRPNQRFDEEIRNSTNPLFSIRNGTLNLKNIHFQTNSENTELVAVTGDGVLSLDTISRLRFVLIKGVPSISSSYVIQSAAPLPSVV